MKERVELEKRAFSHDFQAKDTLYPCKEAFTEAKIFPILCLYLKSVSLMCTVQHVNWP